jgi:hypothetical protein
MANYYKRQHLLFVFRSLGIGHGPKRSAYLEAKLA